jgi:hypothetical protein
MNKVRLEALTLQVDAALDEATDLLGIFEPYDEHRPTHIAREEVLRITRSAVEYIRGAQHVLAMIGEEERR